MIEDFEQFFILCVLVKLARLSILHIWIRFLEKIASCIYSNMRFLIFIILILLLVCVPYFLLFLLNNFLTSINSLLKIYLRFVFFASNFISNFYRFDFSNVFLGRNNVFLGGKHIYIRTKNRRPFPLFPSEFVFWNSPGNSVQPRNFEVGLILELITGLHFINKRNDIIFGLRNHPQPLEHVVYTVLKHTKQIIVNFRRSL